MVRSDQTPVEDGEMAEPQRDSASMNQDAEHREALRSAAETHLAEKLSLEVLRRELRDAVADGIKSAMTPEAARAFWGVGIEMLQKQATQRTANFVFSGVKKVLTVGGWGLLGLVGIYIVGGWPIVMLVWKAVYTTKVTP